MTKLDAVNELLASCGKRPVTVLDTGGASWAAEAERVIDRKELEIQSLGWNYNRRNEVTLSPGGNGKIMVDDTVIEIDSNDTDSDRDVVKMGDHLYDKDNNTDQFTDPVVVTYTERYSFGCIPIQVRRAILDAAIATFNMDWNSGRGQILKEQTARNSLARAFTFNNRTGNVNILDTDDQDRVRGRPRI